MNIRDNKGEGRRKRKGWKWGRWGGGAVGREKGKMWKRKKKG